jgi:hypothetical protein
MDRSLSVLEALSLTIEAARTGDDGMVPSSVQPDREYLVHSWLPLLDEGDST